MNLKSSAMKKARILVFSIACSSISYLRAELAYDSFGFKHNPDIKRYLQSDEYLISFDASESLYRNTRLIISGTYAFQNPSADDLYQEAHDQVIASNLKGEWEQICSVSVESQQVKNQEVNLGVGYRLSYYDFFVPSFGFYHRSVQPALLLPWTLSIKEESKKFIQSGELSFLVKLDSSTLVHELSFTHLFKSKNKSWIIYQLGLTGKYSNTTVYDGHDSNQLSDQIAPSVGFSWMITTR